MDCGRTASRVPSGSTCLLARLTMTVDGTCATGGSTACPASMASRGTQGPRGGELALLPPPRSRPLLASTAPFRHSHHGPRLRRRYHWRSAVRRPPPFRGAAVLCHAQPPKGHPRLHSNHGSRLVAAAAVASLQACNRHPLPPRRRLRSAGSCSLGGGSALGSEHCLGLLVVARGATRTHPSVPPARRRAPPSP